jgi:hypothetical protein
MGKSKEIGNRKKEMRMSDREVLLMTYGALLALCTEDGNEKALIELVEHHLFSEKEKADGE